MATTYEYLEYTIWLDDPDEVAELQARPPRIELANGSVVDMTEAGRVAWGLGAIAGGLNIKGVVVASPFTMATLHGAQIYSNAAQPVIAPGITSPWITGSDANYPITERYFERKSGGWFGISWLFGDKKKYVWVGRYSYKPVKTIDGGEVVGAPADIPRRRWIDGFEHATTNGLWSRDASRHTDGFGMKAITAAKSVVQHTLQENLGTAYNAERADSWERFYMRRRGAPTKPVAFWVGNFSPSEEMVLKLLPTGQILIGEGAGTQFVPFATISEALPDANDLSSPEDGWTKVDLLIHVGTGASLQVYLNGKHAITVTGWGANLNNAAAVHVSSELGIGLNDNSSTVALDFDDWINAEPPSPQLDSIDWLNGTRIVKVPILAAGGEDTGGWTGSSIYLGNKRLGSNTLPDNWTTSVADAVLHLVGDADRYEVDKGAIGPVCVQVGAYKTRTGTGANDYQLGYSVAGGPVQYGDQHTTTGAGTFQFRSELYQPAGIKDPALNKFSPLGVAVKNEGGTPGTTTLSLLFIEVELCGVWGQADVSEQSVGEDLVAGIEVLGNTGKHVSPYPDSIWAQRGVPPVSPVAITSGTFTGNGSSQVLTFAFPVTWLFVRGTSGNARGLWFSSMSTARHGTPQAGFETIVSDLRQVGAGAVSEDQAEYSYELRIAGSTTGSLNGSGETYWYVAFCDPGMRFSLNGALATHLPTVGGLVTKLINPSFLAECLWFQHEITGNTITIGAGMKGPGNTGATVVRLGTAVNNSAITPAPGQLTIGSDWATVFATGGQVAFAAFRRDDGSGDPGIPRVLQLATWVGDGAASRTISFPTATGRRPLFVMIWPESTGTVGFRDPQHTSTNSSTATATSHSNTTSGITAGGIDQFTVGSTFNSNGVVYNAFILVGSDAAGNNGWSQDGEFIPVEPAIPPDWPWLPELPDLPDTIPDDWWQDGGSDDPEVPVEPGGNDFGDQCIDQSAKVCRQALALIGVTQPITDLTADVSPEAEMCRLFYGDVVAEVLRDFDWPVFTKYATLARVYGSPEAPYNGDWTYGYRAPADMIKARRLVRPELGRSFDPDPPKFRLGGSDAGGRIIQSGYRNPETDEPTVELEYTYRPNCAAAQGDALFRLALVYMLAAKLAPAVSRNKVTAGECLAAYEHIKARAMVAAAQELQQGPGDGDAVWIQGR